jgi:hypothetical protein
MADQGNRWQPVTSAYQEELTPRKRRKWLRGRPAKGAVAAPGFEEAEDIEPLPAGIVGIKWFYLLNAAAYFISGSILLSFPLTDAAYKLMRHARDIIPFPVGHFEDVPVVNLLAESLFIMALISGSVAVLWMTRSRAARWLTILYAAAWLVRNGLLLFGNHASALPESFSSPARIFLLADTIADTLILGYLLFAMRASKTIEKLRG